MNAKQFAVDVQKLPYDMENMVVCDRTDAMLDEIHGRGGCDQMERQAAAIIRTAIANVGMHIAARKAQGKPTYSIRDFLEPLLHDAETMIDSSAVEMKEHPPQPGGIFGLIIGANRPRPKK